MKTKKNKRRDDEHTPDDQLPLSEMETGEIEDNPIDRLEAQVAETEARYKRALADYQNSQRRAVDNERRAKEEGMARVVEALVPVLDNFGLALDMDPASTTPEQVIGGVKVIRDEFMRVLATHGVTAIEPVRGESFDPMRHEAMMMAADEDVPPGCVVMMLQKGYALGERVIRAAKVSVRPGDSAEHQPTEPDDAGEAAPETA